MARNLLSTLKVWTKKLMGMENEERYTFPKRLEEFGYRFNEDGQLRHIDTEEPFVFKVSSNHSYNQLRYEALGEVITDHIYNLMEEEEGLNRINVPVDTSTEEPHSFIFVSQDALTKSKLLVLIHGSGAVRAGQWTRKLIINNSIEHGSQLPYIRQAMGEGYGVIVLNPNLNTVGERDEEIEIKDNNSPESHGHYVFQHFVMKAQASCVAFVAHSYGGIVTMELINDYPGYFKEKVFAVAFTDSVHAFRRRDMLKETRLYFKERGCNFAASYAPINTRQNEDNDECPAVSAGTHKHEWTSYTSFEILFDFLAERLNLFVKSEHLEGIQVEHTVLYKPDVKDKTPNVDTTQQPTPYADSTGQLAQDADTTDQSPQDADTTDQSTQDADSTKQSTQDADSTKHSTQDADSTKQSTQDADSTKQSTQDADSTKQSTQDADTTDQSPQDADTTDQSTQDADSTKQSTQDADSTKQSTQDADSTKHSTQDADTTDQSTQDADSTKQSTQDADSTKHSTQDADSTKQSTQDADSTKQSTQDADSTKHHHRMLTQPNSHHRMLHQPNSQHRMLHQPNSQHRMLTQPNSQHRMLTQPNSQHRMLTQLNSQHRMLTQPNSHHRMLTQPNSQHRMLHQPNSQHKMLNQPNC
ncbi:uncharacterized protein LOC124278112 isoform X5 [Haliotis rubra]|uniref:uncharacterized protein LOC124278112 isoform X5 n=1 Tax=Haliotis rubra TaxID=36100 RepID=UPI001EE621D1|nr:uncharacterized protein LOC124278112 isoform X5 [Haliotis rubra]